MTEFPKTNYLLYHFHITEYTNIWREAQSHLIIMCTSFRQNIIFEKTCGWHMPLLLKYCSSLGFLDGSALIGDVGYLKFGAIFPCLLCILHKDVTPRVLTTVHRKEILFIWV